MSRENHLQRGLFAALVLAAYACRRTEWVPVDGGSVTDTPHVTRLADASAPIGEVRGVVVDLLGGSPLEEAVIQLDSLRDLQRTPKSGSFVFRDVSRGPHVLTTKRFGFTAAVDTIHVDSTGVGLQIALGRRTVVATPPLVIERKLPWWKFW